MQRISTLAVAAALALTAPVPALAEPDTSDPATLAELIAKLARAEQKLHDLSASVDTRLENVNKAIAEVQTARDTSDAAQRHVAESQAALDGSTAAITDAQTRADEYVASVYMHGPSAGYLLATRPDDVIADAVQGQTLAISMRQAIADLHRAQTDRTNRNAEARDAQKKADESMAQTQQSLDSAAAELSAARADFAAKRSEVTELVAQRDAAQFRLDAAGTRYADPRYVPEIPVGLLGDPKAIIVGLLNLSANSAQATAEMGRQFMAAIGMATTSGNGITNGNIPVSAGQRASEYVIERAVAQIGVPYSWGGGNAVGPTRGIDEGAHTVGFDCSGLILYAFAGVGILLPHYSGFQYQAGRKVPAAQMRRGDVIFYGPGGSQHVALYLGNGRMLEAPSTGQLVRVSAVRTSSMTPYVLRYIDS